MQDMPTTGRRLVWDLPTRVFHWALAGSFLGAYLLAEQDGARTIHVMFGYTVAALVAFRLLWGFVGGSHSRFSDFAYGPREAVRYLRDLVTGRARDYEGHNPAGSWAIFGLLMLAAATAATGWLHYNGIGGEALEESHELLANAWLAMVFVHLAGVIVASIVHRRSLPATMITGYRNDAAASTADDSTRHASHSRGGVRATRPAWVLGSALLAAVLGFWTWTANTGGGSLLAGAEGAGAGHEHGGTKGAAHDEDDDDD